MFLCVIYFVVVVVFQAQAVTLTVAQAFNIALEAESKEDKEKRNSEMVKQEVMHKYDFFFILV